MTNTAENSGLPAQGATVAERLALAFAISAGVTSVLSALLVVLKETNQDTVLAWMKASTGHHWVTHGLIDLILFVVIGLLVARRVEGLENRTGLSVGIFVGGVALGALIIVGFFAV